MTNDPWRKRTPKSTMVKWLLEHPNVWDGYPKPIKSGCMSHSHQIFYLMQSFGLFAPRSQCNPLTIARLVKLARAAQQLDRDRAAMQKVMKKS